MPDRRLARPIRRGGFTLIEAIVSTAITVMAGSALLLGISSSLRTADDVRDLALANGIAQRLLDDISGKMYCGDPTIPFQYPLGPSATEAASVCRERYDDIDDFCNVPAQVPNDCWGVPLGSDNGQGGLRDPNFRIPSTFFARWQQSVSVFYLNPSNLTQALGAGQTSEYRAAEVTVSYRDPVQGTRVLAKIRRVFTYVPTP